MVEVSLYAAMGGHAARLETAVECGADIVVFMDGDGSDDPADLP
jgi:hypothetical protein